MGRAVGSVAEGAASLVWNPAGLALPGRNEASLSYVDLYEDTSLQEVSIAHSMTASPFGWGLSAIRLDLGSVQKTAASLAISGEDNYYKNAYLLGFACQPMRAWTLGLTGKLFMQEIAGVKSNAADVDAGMLWKFGSFGIGIQGQNLMGSKLERSGGYDELPRSGRAGVSLKLPRLPLLSVDGVFSDAVGSFVRAGLEYQLLGTFALRGGWDGTYPTAGLGFS
ncbi:MAG: hypothetical protein HY747_10760, partial [Elusimicrobia bacterium]|nr:hypothetical protein [Elusimicrobiota bacterium]